MAPQLIDEPTRADRGVLCRAPVQRPAQPSAAGGNPYACTMTSRPSGAARRTASRTAATDDGEPS
jgi:hypothetical protein